MGCRILIVGHTESERVPEEYRWENSSSICFIRNLSPDSSNHIIYTLKTITHLLFLTCMIKGEKFMTLNTLLIKN